MHLIQKVNSLNKVLLNNSICPLFLMVYAGPELCCTCLHGCRVALPQGVCFVKALFSRSLVATDDGLNDE